MSNVFKIAQKYSKYDKNHTGYENSKLLHDYSFFNYCKLISFRKLLLHIKIQFFNFKLFYLIILKALAGMFNFDASKVSSIYNLLSKKTLKDVN